MCPPALHVSIGIFNRLFLLLEQSLNIMDVKIANSLAGKEEKVSCQEIIISGAPARAEGPRERSTIL